MRRISISVISLVATVLLGLLSISNIPQISVPFLQPAPQVLFPEDSDDYTKKGLPPLTDAEFQFEHRKSPNLLKSFLDVRTSREAMALADDLLGQLEDNERTSSRYTQSLVLTLKGHQALYSGDSLAAISSLEEASLLASPQNCWATFYLFKAYKALDQHLRTQPRPWSLEDQEQLHELGEKIKRVELVLSTAVSSFGWVNESLPHAPIGSPSWEMTSLGCARDVRNAAEPEWSSGVDPWDCDVLSPDHPIGLGRVLESVEENPIVHIAGHGVWPVDRVMENNLADFNDFLKTLGVEEETSRKPSINTLLEVGCWELERAIPAGSSSERCVVSEGSKLRRAPLTIESANQQLLVGPENLQAMDLSYSDNRGIGNYGTRMAAYGLAASQEVGEIRSAQSRALVIGIDTYVESSGLSPLQYATRDAQRMADVLTNVGYAPVVLRNDVATKTNILTMLMEEVLNSRPGDSLVLYFSGHGATVANGERILITDSGNAAVTFRELEAVLSYHLGVTTVIADSCFDEQQLEIGSGADILVMGGNETSFVLASSPGGAAIESRQLRSGLFTQALVGYFTRHDRDTDGLLDVDDLIKATAAETARLAKELYDVAQEPVLLETYNRNAAELAHATMLMPHDEAP
ncbi:MAG: caspase family protein [Deltaproteobacteria bacterium]|nr:caspase family protein [Deltaproteobacteria bacterium]